MDIGLTGGIGSGKSTVASMLEALGAALIDTDAIARQLTAAGGAAM
jgi:dephospho-CoA kinase